MHIDDLTTPTLVVDIDRLESNIRRMAAKAERLHVSLRPHIKTHKSTEIALLQRDAGASGITVSTLHEARVFAAAGFDDITWAFPVILNRIPEIVDLARRVRLGVLVDSPEAIDALESSGESLGVFLKVDCGYHRAGVDPDGPLPRKLAERLSASASLTFRGLLTHAGHSYHCATPEAIRLVAAQERDVMVALAERLRASGIPVPAVSVGSTPTMSVVEDLTGIDEIRPGNYAFYDLSQVIYGSCSAADCALTVLTSVVSSPVDLGHSIVDAGALALSKDAGPTELGHDSYGAVFADYSAGELSTQTHLGSLSQEHGVVNSSMLLGERLRVLPNHSCLTAAQFDEYVVVSGDQVIDRWPILRQR